MKLFQPFLLILLIFSNMSAFAQIKPGTKQVEGLSENLHFLKQLPLKERHYDSFQQLLSKRGFVVLFSEKKLAEKLLQELQNEPSGHLFANKQAQSWLEKFDKKDSLEVAKTALYFDALLFAYVDFLHRGLLDVQEMKGQEWFHEPKKNLNYALIFKQIEKGVLLKDIFKALKANYQSSQGLYAYIAQYEQIRQNGGWKALPDTLKKLKPGDNSAHIEALRKRLVSGNHLDKKYEKGTLFDDTVALALCSFQKLMGLHQDSVCGEATLRCLNVPVETWIKQMYVSIERAKSMPLIGTERSLWINIADYQLTVFENKKVLTTHKVIVGAKSTQTPCFSDTLENIVLNPYWYVPVSIVKGELAPSASKNNEYLSKRNYEVFSKEGKVESEHIDWSDKSKVSGYSIRQRPGSGNALGYYKFNFPNKWSIYLHDTPNRHLFSRDLRAYSHGCMRLHEPQRLALLLLEKQPQWDKAQMDTVIRSKKSTTIRLTEKIPVYVVYQTAWVDANNQLALRFDIYGRDALFAEELQKNKYF